jgi:hypothetical protein
MRSKACDTLLMETASLESSSADRALVAAPSLTNRSKVTNGTRLLEGMDKRSATGRRFRDLVQAYAAPLGGMLGLGAADAAVVREIAAKTIQSEQLAAALARGESVDTEQSVRVANVLGRLLSRLERRGKALRPNAPRSALAAHFEVAP